MRACLVISCLIVSPVALEAQQLAVVKVVCSVGISEVTVTSPSESSTDIHSAGLTQGLDIFGDLAFDSSIAVDHSIDVQSRGIEVAFDFGNDFGEVHTYARATVNKGFLYVADLDAHKSTKPSIAEACEAQIMLESLDEPPLDPTDGPDTRSCSPECGSPIVIDLDRGGFTFTDLDGGVRFDLTPGGVLEEIAWTETGSEHAFLVLDRNGNGAIDDGSELFGDATPQPDADEPNGFRALAVFDVPLAGGNGDRSITAEDAVFHQLRLWIDRNHDGMAQTDELSTLASQGILSIDLDPVESRRRDRYGNELRYTSRVQRIDSTTQAVDVFFLQRETSNPH